METLMLFKEEAEKLLLSSSWHAPKEEVKHIAYIIGGGSDMKNNHEPSTLLGVAREDLRAGDTISIDQSGLLSKNSSPLKDSGTRDQFSTGAVRDADTTKGRMDLVPMDVVGEIFKYAEGTVEADLSRSQQFAMIATDIERLIWHENLKSAYNAVISYSRYVFDNLEEAMFEVAIHYKDGAAKYSERNWQKGIPLHRFICSAENHLLKWHRGDDDEPHDRAFLWNLICYIWTVQRFPVTNTEICDLPWCEEKRKTLKEPMCRE